MQTEVNKSESIQPIIVSQKIIRNDFLLLLFDFQISFFYFEFAKHQLDCKRASRRANEHQQINNLKNLLMDSARLSAFQVQLKTESKNEQVGAIWPTRQQWRKRSNINFMI